MRRGRYHVTPASCRCLTEREDRLRNLSAADLPAGYRGLSGAPVVVGRAVRAMLQTRVNGGLVAILLACLHGYPLLSQNVIFDTVGRLFISSDPPDIEHIEA